MPRLRTIGQQIALERMADDNLNRGIQRREQRKRSPTMPDAAKMTEGERIADLASGTMVTSHGNRLPPSIKRWIAERIDSTLAARDAQLAAKDAEIERLRAMLWKVHNQIPPGMSQVSSLVPLSGRHEIIALRSLQNEIAALLKDTTNDHQA